MKRAVLTVAVLLMLVGCSSSGSSQDPLTESEVRAMSDEEVVAMGNCQMQKVIDEKGQEEGMTYVTDLTTKTINEDGPPIQVLLSREGYDCNELR